MRLQFSLEKITVSASCHIQIARHADQYVNRYAAGQLYGELYDDIAHITNTLQFPQPEQMSTKQELEAMQTRHKDMIMNFNLDNTNLGWYMICYHEDFWNSLQAVKYYEKYINMSFFLVYDYQARQRGKNPYKGFRLTDSFIGKQTFKFSQLLKNSDVKENPPFIEIPVEVEKDQIFELLMLFNKKKLLENMRKKHESKYQKNVLKQKMESYIQTLEENTESHKIIAQKIVKEKDESEFSQFCHYLGMELKAKKQEQSLRSYEQNFQKLTEKLSDL